MSEKQGRFVRKGNVKSVVNYSTMSSIIHILSYVLEYSMYKGRKGKGCKEGSFPLLVLLEYHLPLWSIVYSL